MKKLNILNVLCAAAALSFVFPSCNGLVDTGEGASAVVAEDGKIAVKVSASESYRTIISTLPSDISYELSIAGKADTATADVAKSYTLSSLSDSPLLYLDAGTYTFTLTGTSGEKAIVSGSTEKTISTSDANVAISLNAVTGEAVSVTLNLTVPGASDYGLDSVEAAVFDDASLTTASSDSLSAEAGDDGTYTVSGTVTSGANKWVKLTLKDSDGTVIGSKTEALFAISNAAISADVTAQASKYKATIVLTASEAKALTLKNSAVTSASYTGIALAASEATGSSGTYTYTKYIPVGSYGIYCDGNSIGTVSSVTTASADAGKYLTGISAAWNTTEGTQPTFYTSSTIGDVLEAISITETYSDNSTDTVAAKESGKEAVVSVEGFSQESTDAQTLTLSYNGKTTTISVTLTAVALESISVAANDGEELTYAFEATEPTWTDVLAVTAHYNDGDKVVTDYTVTGWDSSSAGEKTLTVTFGEETATFTVTIEKQGVTLYKFGTALANAEKTSKTFTVTGANEVLIYKVPYALSDTTKIAISADVTSTAEKDYVGVGFVSFKDGAYMNGELKEQLFATGGGVRYYNATKASWNGSGYSSSTKSEKDTTYTYAVDYAITTAQYITASITPASGSADTKSNKPTSWFDDSSAVYLAIGAESASGTATVNISSIKITIGDETFGVSALENLDNDTRADVSTSTTTATYEIPSTVESSSKGDSYEITLSDVTYSAEVVSGTTTVAGTWAWKETTVTYNGSDDITTTAVFTPSDTTAYKTLTQEVTITVTDNRAESSVAKATIAFFDSTATALSMAATKTDKSSILTTVSDATYTALHSDIDSAANWNAAKSVYGLSCGNGTNAITVDEDGTEVDFFKVTFDVTPAKAVTVTNIGGNGYCNKTSNFKVKVSVADTKLVDASGSSNTAALATDIEDTVTLNANTSYTFTVLFYSVKKSQTFKTAASKQFTLADLSVTLTEVE